MSWCVKWCIFFNLQFYLVKLIALICNPLKIGIPYKGLYSLNSCTFLTIFAGDLFLFFFIYVQIKWFKNIKV